MICPIDFITPCLYADDTQIIASSNNYAELIELAKNKLQHHPTKTKVMIIGSSYSLNNKVYDYHVMLNSKVISRTDSFECLGLGVLFDEKMSGDLHVEKTCKKIGCSIAL